MQCFVIITFGYIMISHHLVSDVIDSAVTEREQCIYTWSESIGPVSFGGMQVITMRKSSRS